MLGGSSREKAIPTVTRYLLTLPLLGSLQKVSIHDSAHWLSQRLAGWLGRKNSSKERHFPCVPPYSFKAVLLVSGGMLGFLS